MAYDSVLEDIQNRAVNNAPIGSTLKLDFGDGQIIYLDGTGEANTVSGEDKDAACLVQVKLEDMEDLLAGKLNPMTAFMFGKLKVKGDMGVAMKLQAFLG